MASVIDVKKERVWTGLLDGFEKYLAVLTERASLIQETDALKQQVSREVRGLNQAQIPWHKFGWQMCIWNNLFSWKVLIFPG